MIDTLPLFQPLDQLLRTFLAGLSRDDWHRPTIAGAWTVRDVAAHLVDTPLRRLAFVRDGWPPAGAQVGAEADLVALVNARNAEGVRVYGRLSPPVLIDLLQLASSQLADHLADTPPAAPAVFPVSWAGEHESAHWFDVAREYTERWHHQAQIRLAVGAPHLAPLLHASFHAPVLATFMRAIPHACRSIPAVEGAMARIDIEGEGGGAWCLRRAPAHWILEDARSQAMPGSVSTHVRIPAALAWRLFTKGASATEVAAQCGWEGEPTLARAILQARAIVG